MEELVKKMVAAIIGSSSDDVESLVGEREDLRESAWSLLNQVNEALQECDMTEQQRSTYSTLLDQLTAIANPKELTYAFLESCDAFRNTSLFLVIVPYLGQSLKLLPEKQRSVEIVCSTLYSHVCTCLNTAQDYQVCEDEKTPGNSAPRLVIDKTSRIELMLDVVRVMVEKFVVPMVQECSYVSNREALTSLLLQLLHYPLLYLHENSIPGDLLQSILTNFQLLQPTTSKLLTDPTQSIGPEFSHGTMISNPLDDARSRNNSCVHVGLASFLSCLSESDVSCGLPQVYSPQFRFIMVLPCLHSLFIRSSNCVVGLKAVILLERSLAVIGKGELSHQVLEVSSIKHTIQFICWSMQFADLLATRQCAARTLPLLCSRFDLKGRYLIFLTILNEEESPEILSFTYTLVKDFVHECWTTGSVDSEKYCQTLMRQVFAVPDGDGGQLIADLNKISSALNLARYLVARNIKRTSPLTKNMNSYIQAYIQPIGKCLQAQLLALDEKLKQLSEGTVVGPAMSVDVGGETVDYSASVEREATLDAINRLHLVLHVHGCLLESLSLC